MQRVPWENSHVSELDLTSTELSTECLLDILPRMPGFTFLGLGHCEFFNDMVSDGLLLVAVKSTYINLD